ncbi:MAG: ATP synthase F1 subunit epsilon, partial [Rhodospirillales bacterium]|jgi:F-type H+-transporting ATPase subunit epsilon
MADKVQFEIVTPDKLLTAEEADMVVVPGDDGDFGVLPGHSPLLSSVRPGVIDVHEDGAVKTQYFIAGGFAEVDPEKCVVLADEAMAVSDLDKTAAQQRLEAAQAALVDAGDTDIAQKNAQAEVVRAEAMVAAAETLSA